MLLLPDKLMLQRRIRSPLGKRNLMCYLAKLIVRILGSRNTLHCGVSSFYCTTPTVGHWQFSTHASRSSNNTKHIKPFAVPMSFLINVIHFCTLSNLTTIQTTACSVGIITNDKNYREILKFSFIISDTLAFS